MTVKVQRHGDNMLSTKEAADKLGVSRQRVCVWIKEGRIPAERVGNVWVLPDDVEKPEPIKPGRK